MPLPEPFGFEVIVIHDALLTADQEHPPASDIVILPKPPLATNEALVGETT
jgi:hypothetical protein